MKWSRGSNGFGSHSFVSASAPSNLLHAIAIIRRARCELFRQVFSLRERRSWHNNVRGLEHCPARTLIPESSRSRSGPATVLPHRDRMIWRDRLVPVFATQDQGAGWRPLLRSLLLFSTPCLPPLVPIPGGKHQADTSKITSSSTGVPSGRLATPYTKRQGLLSFPKTSCSNSEAASATFG